MKDRQKSGRKLAQIDLIELEKLCVLHCSDEEIAKWFGVSTRTIVNRRQRPEFAQAMQRGRARGCVSVRREQMKILESGNSTMGVWLGKAVARPTRFHHHRTCGRWRRPHPIGHETRFIEIDRSGTPTITRTAEQGLANGKRLKMQRRSVIKIVRTGLPIGSRWWRDFNHRSNFTDRIPLRQEMLPKTSGLASPRVPTRETPAAPRAGLTGGPHPNAAATYEPTSARLRALQRGVVPIFGAGKSNGCVRVRMCPSLL
jgi:hypothetical protein